MIDANVNCECKAFLMKVYLSIRVRKLCRELIPEFAMTK